MLKMSKLLNTSEYIKIDMGRNTIADELVSRLNAAFAELRNRPCPQTSEKRENGKDIMYHSVILTPLLVGHNGCAKRKIRFKTKISRYPDSDEIIDGFSIDAEQDLKECFLNKYRLSISSGSDYYLLSREICYDPRKLPAEFARFQQDLMHAKSYLSRMKKKHLLII